MKDYKIFVDSAANLTPELMEEYDLDYAVMPVTVGDKVYPATMGWIDISAKKIYELMDKGVVPHTSQINPNDFELKFEPYLEKGIDILYVACSSGLSKSINSAYIAKDTLLEKYPDNKIVIVDALIACVSQGLLGMMASNLKKEGKTIEEVEQALIDNRLHYHQWGTVNTLEYLKNAGRVKTSSAFFGDLFGIKPILCADLQGRNYAFKKVRGRKNAIDALATLVKENVEDPENHFIYIAQAECMDDALLLKDKIQEYVPNCKEIRIIDIGWIVGCSTGPTTLNVYHYGKLRTIEGE